jgi:hypothetical protein
VKLRKVKFKTDFCTATPTYMPQLQVLVYEDEDVAMWVNVGDFIGPWPPETKVE